MGERLKRVTYFPGFKPLVSGTAQQASRNLISNN